MKFVGKNKSTVYLTKAETIEWLSPVAGVS